jgi:hypothetical protein
MNGIQTCSGPEPARVASSPGPCLGKTGRRATRRTRFHVECRVGQPARLERFVLTPEVNRRNIESGREIATPRGVKQALLKSR